MRLFSVVLYGSMGLLMGASAMAGEQGDATTPLGSKLVEFLLGADQWQPGERYRSGSQWLALVCSKNGLPVGARQAHGAPREVAGPLRRPAHPGPATGVPPPDGWPRHGAGLVQTRPRCALAAGRAGAHLRGPPHSEKSAPPAKARWSWRWICPSGGQATLVPLFDAEGGRFLLQLRAQGKRQLLDELGLCSHTVSTDYLVWAGDLDRDGQPDYLIDFADEVGEAKLYLARAAAAKELAGVAGVYVPSPFGGECDGGRLGVAMIQCLLSQRIAALAWVLGAAWLAVAAHAQDKPTGAWKGTIGQAPVMVCLTDDSQAQYYYLRHRRNIALVPPQGAVDPRDKPQAIAQAWKTGDFRLDETVPGPNGESRISGRWMLQATSPTQITGTWTAPDKGKAQPISLRKAIPTPATESAPLGGDCEPALLRTAPRGDAPEARTCRHRRSPLPDRVQRGSHHAPGAGRTAPCQGAESHGDAMASSPVGAVLRLQRRARLAGIHGFGRAHRQHPHASAVDGCLPRAARQHARDLLRRPPMAPRPCPPSPGRGTRDVRWTPGPGCKAGKSPSLPTQASQASPLRRA
jgi:hypothetical protein